MLDGWSLRPQSSVGVLQQLSGTILPFASLERIQTLSAQSDELLLPQHLNWREMEENTQFIFGGDFDGSKEVKKYINMKH